MIQDLTDEQRAIFYKIVHATEKETEDRCWMVEGSGGTGKTFLYKTLYHYFTSTGKNVCKPVVSLLVKVKMAAPTGIASTLLIDATTLHRLFFIPLDCDANSTCNIDYESPYADVSQRMC